MFFRNQRVVCLSSAWGSFTEPHPWCPNRPVVKSIYTIRTAERIVAHSDGVARWFLRLNEVVNPENESHGTKIEPVFAGQNFRPLVDDEESEAFDNRVKLTECV